MQRADDKRRRFKAPWRVVEKPGCYTVEDAGGQTLGYFYFGRQTVGTITHLTKDEARRLAYGFAKLPALMQKSPPAGEG